MSTYDNQPPLDGWCCIPHRDSPLTPATEVQAILDMFPADNSHVFVEPSEDHLIRGTE